MAVAASLQLHAAAQYRRRKAWGSLLELEDAETGFYRYLSFFLALIVGCFYPGFSNLPYAVASLTLLWTWSQGGPPGGTSALGVVHLSRVLKGCQVREEAGRVIRSLLLSWVSLQVLSVGLPSMYL